MADNADECCRVPLAGIVDLPANDDEANETLARYAKALGHPARVAILRQLARRGSCVCGEIVSELPLAQSTVSQHLKQLKEAGLVQGEIDGPRICYCIRPEALAALGALVGALAKADDTREKPQAQEA